jgi:hypothetical protein
MSNFAQDTFGGTNGTLLTAHTDGLGNTWSQIFGATDQIVLNGSNGITAGGNSANYIDINSGSPPSADYTVQCDTVGTGSTAQAGPMARCSSANGGNGYVALIGDATTSINLYKLVSGSFSLLANADLESSTQTAVQIQVTGQNIKANINGTNYLSVTDSSISAAGNAGVQCFNNTILKNFQAFGAAGSPFSQNDWPNPSPAKYPQSVQPPNLLMAELGPPPDILMPQACL